ncbi:hypothetical protein BX666DRAFT_660801 [Dichotomocladium elegans]|nr:hypothetical protein BX666DRAFT_660801 [Dichotomocladium elegans]
MSESSNSNKSRSSVGLLHLRLPSVTSLHPAHKKLVEEAIACSLQLGADKLVVNIELDRDITNVDVSWHELQGLLCSLYVTQLTYSYAKGVPLFDCTFVFQSWCGYNVGLEPHLRMVFISEQDASRALVWNEERKKLGISALDIRPLKTSAEPKEFMAPPPITVDERIFEKVAVGGTFDHIHGGHKILLTMTALLAAECIVVGVTDDIMLKSKKFREQIQPIEDRLKSVRDFLHTVRRGLEYEIVPITDPFGPTITDPAIQALVCSKETESGGIAVNDEREKRNFPHLALRIIDVISSESASVDGDDMGSLKISSTWIRQYIAGKKMQ